MRVLGLDWGSVRVGAAISDPSGKIAFPLQKFIDKSTSVAEIKKIVDEQKVEKIIVGLPKTLAGEDGLAAKKVEEFINDLKEKVICPIEQVDERYTTLEATKKLNNAGMDEREQRSVRDNVAAQIMLQQYLDNN